MELEPGPPFSHIVSCDVGSRAAMNQKKVLVGYGPGMLTQPVYCCWESKTVWQVPFGGVLYKIVMVGSAGEIIVVRFETGGYWAIERGRRDSNRANARRYMIVRSYSSPKKRKKSCGGSCICSSDVSKAGCRLDMPGKDPGGYVPLRAGYVGKTTTTSLIDDESGISKIISLFCFQLSAFWNLSRCSYPCG